MKKKLALALALVMTMSVALTACGGGGKLTFTTGGDQGTYYGFGTVLAGQISDKTKTTVTAVVGKGSKGNIEAMNVKDAQLGFVQSDVMAYAYNGERLFEKKVESFSTVAALYMEQVQIVTLDPSIKSVADLKGKNVSVGESGSGVYFNAVDVLAAYDLDVEKDIKPTYQGFGVYIHAVQEPGTLGNKLRYTWYQALDFVQLVWFSLVQLFTGGVSVQELSGPVGIVSTITQVGESSQTALMAVQNIAFLAALIAVNLAVMNLLPVPALDGGRIFFLLVDQASLLLFRRKVPERYQAYVNTAGVVVLMGFMLLVTLQDVFKLFR